MIGHSGRTVCAAGLAIILCVTACDRQPQTEPKSNFADVVSTKTIRCGYVVAPPHVIKDPRTGIISGIIPSIMNDMAKNLHYKIVWSEEVGWGTMVEGLNTGRYDAVCGPIWPSSTRAQFAEFSVPLYYSGVGAYVRTNDHRFDRDLSAIDRPEVRVATTDGEISQIITDQRFPRSSRVTLPQLTDLSQLLLNVVQSKADVVFMENSTAEQFVEKNPGLVRNVTLREPLRAYPNTIMYARGNYALKSLLDSALSELGASGDIDRDVQAYSRGEKVFYPVARPYRVE